MRNNASFGQNFLQGSPQVDGGRPTRGSGRDVVDAKVALVAIASLLDSIRQAAAGAGFQGFEEGLNTPFGFSLWEKAAMVTEENEAETLLRQQVIDLAAKISHREGAPQSGLVSYGQARLRPLWARLQDPDKPKRTPGIEDRFILPLGKLSPRTLFPVRDMGPETCAGLFQSLKEAMAYLDKWGENPDLWLEHLDSLLMIYTATMPAISGGRLIDDVSLYDQARTTAAMAVALYLYHRLPGMDTAEAREDMTQEKFLLVSGDFHGIQSFIFSEHGDTRRYRAKMLRGRSLAVSMFSELAADLVCRSLGLPSISVVLNAAGRFCILAAKTPDASRQVEEAEKEINNWLVQMTYGEVTIGLTVKAAALQDLTGENLAGLWERIEQGRERKKLARIDLNTYGGSISGYLEKFKNNLRPPLCPLCGKRPSQMTGRGYMEQAEAVCNLCYDHVYLGTNLVKKNRLLVTEQGQKEAPDNNRLMEPIFGRYQVEFRDGGEDLNPGESRCLLKYWDLTIDPEGRLSLEVPVKLINGYIPVCTKDDREDVRLGAGEKGAAKREELKKQIEPGDPKTLEHLAILALEKGEKPENCRGLEALGVLKADVDELGFWMACGLPSADLTFPRLASLSRQLHLYFSFYLPHLLKTEPKFQDIYTVFAGGDDLFVIGPWNCTIKLIRRLSRTFGEFIGNKEIHFSAGLDLQKSHTPLDRMAAEVEEALGQSKRAGRNRLTLFGETVTWDEMEKLMEIKETIAKWVEDKWLKTSMLYRFNELSQMAGEEGRLNQEESIHVDNLSCLRWWSLLAYTTARNVGKDLKDQERRQEAVLQVRKNLAGWLTDYRSKLRIPLWMLLYEQR